MQTGGLAFLDCLGFKGIWRKHSPEAVLGRLQLIQREADEFFQTIPKESRMRIHTAFLADTIVVGVTIARECEFLASVALHLTAIAASKVMQTLLDGDPSIVVRGCLNFGQFIVRGSHIIGPAIDDAHTLHERTNGAIVWLRPDLAPLLDVSKAIFNAGTPPNRMAAANMLGEFSRIRLPSAGQGTGTLSDDILRSVVQRSIQTVADHDHLWLEYPVPMKTGDVLQCPVLNPFWGMGRDIAATFERYSRAMSDTSLDVMVKSQNTMRFLVFAAGQSKATIETDEKLRTRTLKIAARKK